MADKKKKNDNEAGVALIAALALLATLSLLVASMVTLSQYTSVENSTFDAMSRSCYLAESAANRSLLLLSRDSGQAGVRLGAADDAAGVRYRPDGRIHPMELHGAKVTVQICDAIGGRDVAGAFPGRSLQETRLSDEQKERLTWLGNRLNDYVDQDDLVRSGSMEQDGYLDAGTEARPRNRPLQFREELRFIPGFSAAFPVSEDGRLDSFRLIAPEKLKSLAGQANLFASPESWIAERCLLDESERHAFAAAMRQWQQEGVPLEKTLPQPVLQKLTAAFSLRQSGCFTITVNSASADTPGIRLRVTLRLDPPLERLEYYEYNAW